MIAPDTLAQHRAFGVALTEEWMDALEEMRLDMQLVSQDTGMPIDPLIDMDIDKAEQAYDLACLASMWPGPLEPGWEQAIEFMEWSDN